MPLYLRDYDGKWKWHLFFPAIPFSIFGNAVVMTGYFLVLEALYNMIFRS